MAFLIQNKAKLCKILFITLVFEKNANFFAENCDHNIDPWMKHIPPIYNNTHHLNKTKPKYVGVLESYD
jgi:hypothetical protein